MIQKIHKNYEIIHDKNGHNNIIRFYHDGHVFGQLEGLDEESLKKNIEHIQDMGMNPIIDAEFASTKSKKKTKNETAVMHQV